MCYEVQNFLLWNGGEKHSKNTAPFPFPRQKKKQKFLDLTERGKSNDIAHGSIIQVSTVVYFAVYQAISINSTFSHYRKFQRVQIIRYLRSRLAVSTTLDVMDSTLGAGILKKIPNDISEMYSTCFNRLYGGNRLHPVWKKLRGTTVLFCDYSVSKWLFQNFRMEGKRSFVWGNEAKPLYPNRSLDIDYR